MAFQSLCRLLLQHKIDKVLGDNCWAHCILLVFKHLVPIGCQHFNELISASLRSAFKFADKYQITQNSRYGVRNPPPLSCGFWASQKVSSSLTFGSSPLPPPITHEQDLTEGKRHIVKRGKEIGGWILLREARCFFFLCHLQALSSFFPPSTLHLLLSSLLSVSSLLSSLHL